MGILLIGNIVKRSGNSKSGIPAPDAHFTPRDAPAGIMTFLTMHLYSSEITTFAEYFPVGKAIPFDFRQEERVVHFKRLTNLPNFD